MSSTLEVHTMSIEVGTTKVVEVIELVGISLTSWSDAARNALEEASRNGLSLGG
jgi:flavin-binding protein dodecin